MTADFCEKCGKLLVEIDDCGLCYWEPYVYIPDQSMMCETCAYAWFKKIHEEEEREWEEQRKKRVLAKRNNSCD